MTTALLPTSLSSAATRMWQTTEAVAAYAYPATPVFAGHSAGTGIGGFAAPAVVADKHSRQAKPAAPPRGPR
ncbi:hypothetical protein [Jatrophihabitans sp.]|uniref:hypothetical protein n=1 Tax=Jatrophihabitans sp. TaxID=1932789 RepID=UPI0030C6A297